MKKLAHIRTNNGIREEQPLSAHCIQTAKYASEELKEIGLYHVGYIAGLLHDIGKASEKFQEYLEKAWAGEDVVRGSVQHTATGVIFILERYHNGKDFYRLLTTEMIAYGIGGHHGLFDCVNPDGINGFQYRLEKDKDKLEYEEAVKYFQKEICPEGELDCLFEEAVKEIRNFIGRIKPDCKDKSDYLTQIGFMTRMVLACVIDADRIDTCEFMGGKPTPQREADAQIWKKQLEYLEDKLAQFSNSKPIDRVRRFISEECAKAGQLPHGIYRISVPTGGGKTLSTLRFALSHAMTHEKKRIILITPLLSVLDQNAKAIREYLKDESLITEHHSNVVREDNAAEEETGESDFFKENWGTPVIISTMVQFLNLLFKHKTSCVRRMQALMDSVIVLDEVQTIPKRTIGLFNHAMNFLVSCCNTTVILSSATQPCFEEVPVRLHLMKNPDIVLLSKEQQIPFQRSEVCDCVTPYGMEMTELADFCMDKMAEVSSLLLVCNTKAEAKAIYQYAMEVCQEYTFYLLSTAKCQEHRVETLEQIRRQLEDLRKGKSVKKMICISTQIVEAGVDFSFQAVVRIMAGMDNLAQVAGRCNRSNEYGEGCKVYLVKLKGERLSALKEIEQAQKSTESILERWRRGDYSSDKSILDPEVIHDYYENLFAQAKGEMKYPCSFKGEFLYLTDLFSCNKAGVDQEKLKSSFVLKQAFLTAGELFEVFDSEKIDIIVPYEKGGKDLIADFHSERAKHDYGFLQELIQKSRKFTISVFEYEKQKLIDYGWLSTDPGKRVYILDTAAYKDDIGLDIKSDGENSFLCY